MSISNALMPLTTTSEEEHPDYMNHPSIDIIPEQSDKEHRHSYRHSTGNIIDMLSAAAQHCAGPKAVNFRRLNFDFAVPHAKKYRKSMSQSLGTDDDWEFVDFERVFSKAPGMGGAPGVLENCEILFRSVPDSPIHHLCEDAQNPAAKLNDHPFEFKSKEVSRNNTAPGTPDRSELRVPSSIAPSSLSTDAEKLPGAAKRRSYSRDSNFVEPPKGKAPAPARVRTTSMSSTASDLDNEDDRKVAKLEKNRQSARDCRKRKKEYIVSLERNNKDLKNENARLEKELEDKKKVIAKLMAEIQPPWDGRENYGAGGAGICVTTSSGSLKRKINKQQLTTAEPLEAGGDVKRVRL